MPSPCLERSASARARLVHLALGFMGLHASGCAADTAASVQTDEHTSSSAVAASQRGTTAANAVKRRIAEFRGKRTLAGQHNREPNADPNQSTTAVRILTGRYPALWGGDFLFAPSDVNARQTMVREAKRQWDMGAMVTLMWHACPPTRSDTCWWNGGVQSHLDANEWWQLTSDGMPLNRIWKSRLDRIAVHLQALRDQGVAVLFRPFHEMNQGAFWWGGRPGPGGTAKLYQLTRDYLVHEKGLDNLVWIWNVQDLGTNFKDYDPGESYFDIASLDVYERDGFTRAKYDALRAVSHGKPIAIGECATLPTESELAEQPEWIYFMGWSELVFSANSHDRIRSLYASKRVMTLGDMPAWR